ncbi:MAG: hypothetical protein R3F62_22760 [Planctomycetota bacterium]
MTPNDTHPSPTVSDPRIERKLGDALLDELVAQTLDPEARRVLALEVPGGGE